MLSTEHSFEWLKILASTLAGLFTGLIAEPIKSTLQRKIEVVRLERAIKLDCLRILGSVASTQAGLVNNPRSFWQVEMLPAYQHYWASQRELFYADFDLQVIQMKCATIGVIRQSVVEERKNPSEAMAQTETLAREILNIREDRKGFRPHVRRFLLRFVT